MADDRSVLQVYKAGPSAVVGFGGRDVLDDTNVALCRDQMLALIDEHACREMHVDLTGVRQVPSGLLGLLATIRRRNIEVHLYNPSPDVREVLSITNLDKIMPVHDVPIPKD
jgi:anti-sigma B factor antagonist